MMIIRNIIGYFKFPKASLWIFGLMLLLILSRFAMLNVQNWNSGYISNGMPGVKLAIDSERYISAAENMSKGVALQGREYQFAGYIGLLAIIKTLNLSLNWVVVVQLFVALAAGMALFDSVRVITENRWAALMASGLYLCNPFLVCWHQYVMTESLYTSLVILVSWALLRLLNKPKPLFYFAAAVFVVFALLIRPNGWILLPVAAIAMLYSLRLSRRVFGLLSSVVVLMFFSAMGLVNVFNKSVMITSPVANLQRGLTVWGHPELSLTMPQEPAFDTSRMAGAVRYVAKHPLHSARLGAVRAGYSLIHIRPYHTVNYKWHLLLWIVPAYLLAIAGLIHFRRKPQLIVVSAVIAAHLLVVAVSYAEHDSRFDTYILPVFYLLAGLGIAALSARICRAMGRNCGNDMVFWRKI
ncbi:MAG TPA: glycosyltransferase family 39 protein [Bacteroidales bacterium]|nr:glycosyltransferase family 39 protein [Bacteroidales bacterium]